MAKKSTIKTYLPWLLVAGAGVAAYMYFRPKKTDETQELTPVILPPLPPGTPPEDTTPAPVPVAMIMKPVQINKSAKVKKGIKTYGYITKSRGVIYPKGGTDNFGGLKAEIYAGTVEEVDNVWGSARVSNFEYPMKSRNTDGTLNNVYSYWLKLEDIEGSY
jgi:hypothetical protein